MKDNILEDYIVLTNLLYLASLPISIYKGIRVATFGIIGIFVFSTEYHVCYEPVQVLTNTHYNLQPLCIIDDIQFYGIITMFFDVFFANFNAYIIFVYLLMTNKSLRFRYAIMAIGLFAIAVIGCFVGFFPDKRRPFEDVFTMIQYTQFHSDQTNELFWGRLMDMLSTLARTNKTMFITLFSMFYTGSFTLYFILSYMYDHISKVYYSEKFNKDLNLFYYSFRIIVRYYQRRFNLLLLFISIVVGVTGLFVWIVIEGIYPVYYIYTHGFWHICTAFSLFLFLLAVKIEGFNTTVKKQK
jgi:hypothetical protein